MTRPPLIGVTTSEVRAAVLARPLKEGDPPQPEMALGMVYMRAVELAGGLPVVLPPLAPDRGLTTSSPKRSSASRRSKARARS